MKTRFVPGHREWVPSREFGQTGHIRIEICLTGVSFRVSLSGKSAAPKDGAKFSRPKKEMACLCWKKIPDLRIRLIATKSDANMGAYLEVEFKVCAEIRLILHINFLPELAAPKRVLLT